ncbi:hypothetical protein GGI43DRAFT_417844 [Trichoderma evansii]
MAQRHAIYSAFRATVPLCSAQWYRQGIYYYTPKWISNKCLVVVFFSQHLAMRCPRLGPQTEAIANPDHYPSLCHSQSGNEVQQRPRDEMSESHATAGALD